MMIKRITTLLLACCLALGCVCSAAAQVDYSQLHEELYFDVLWKSADPSSPQFALQPPELSAMYIALMFDAEIQWDGMATSMWNYDSSFFCLVPDALRIVGLDDVADLYTQFLEQNNITPEEIDSYRVRFPNPTDPQFYELHPFDAFDDSYMLLCARTNIYKRMVEYAWQYPDIFDISPAPVDDGERSAGEWMLDLLMGD